METEEKPGRAINTLDELNDELARLGKDKISLAHFKVRGASLAMLDAEIRESKKKLFGTITPEYLIEMLKPGLTKRVDTYPITIAYDGHGDKHFIGGGSSEGTKFRGEKGKVNEFIMGKIKPLVGRIRRFANGQTRTFYLRAEPNDFTKPQAMLVQVDYVYSPKEKIEFHGYPADFTGAYGLAETAKGTVIP